MDKIIIQGENRLEGRVKIGGAKNAVLPILAACLMGEGGSTIYNVPQLRDVKTMETVLTSLGARVESGSGWVKVDPSSVNTFHALYEIVRTMRASYYVLCPLLLRFGKARVSLPGGCVIGPRPLDLHLKGLRALGVEIDIIHGYIEAQIRKLRGNRIYLRGPQGSSVGATINVMMAAVKAEGKTIIEHAACEPEVEDTARFLCGMGAKISGAGTPLITIDGVKELRGTEYRVIPDRIEAGTYATAAAITGGDIWIEDCYPGHMQALLEKLRESRVEIEEKRNTLHVKVNGKLTPVDVTTAPYPGFPTDLQAPMMALMSVTEGISIITEKIYESRFLHVAELLRMGANIQLRGNSAIVKGVPYLSGAPVMASDLRASVGLVLAGLVARGETVISRVYHLDRGYERIEEKLSALGARIQRVKK